MLTPYWAERLGKNEMKARQISARGGDLICTLNGARVGISGRACEFMKGEITF
jgi:predicted PhzF superfamily epimerase YddE/YHI9